MGSEKEIEEEGPRTSSLWATCGEMPTNLDSRSSGQLHPSESVNPIASDAEDVLMTEPPGRRPLKETLEGGPQDGVCIRRASATAGLLTLSSTRRKEQMAIVLERFRSERSRVYIYKQLVEDRSPLVEALLRVWFREATRLQLTAVACLGMAFELCCRGC